MNIKVKDWLALEPVGRYLKIRRAFVNTQLKQKQK